MKSFKDKDGVEWIIDLNLSHIKHMEILDFTEATQGEFERIKFLPPQEDLFTHVITNPAINFEMVWCCCQEQAEKREIETSEDFAKRFDGRTLQESRVAMYEELPPFFPEALTTLVALIEKYSKAQKYADQRMTEILNRQLGDKEMEAMVDGATEQLETDLEIAIQTVRDGITQKKEE